MMQGIRVRGVAVRVEAGWLLVFGLVTWTLAVAYFPRVLPDAGAVALWAHAVVAALSLFTSIVVHEVAHAVVARSRGVGVSAITLHLFGGISELEEEPASPSDEVLIAIAGPLTSFALAALAHAASGVAAADSSAHAILRYTAVVNLFVGGFNLVPAFPLDGGRVLRAALWAWRGTPDWATVAATRVSTVLAVAIAAAGAARAVLGDIVGGVWLVLIGLYVQQAAHASGKLAALRGRLERVRVADVMLPAAEVDELRAASRGRGATFLRADDSAWVALLRLSRAEAGRLPVVDGDIVVGVLDRRRLQQAIVRLPPGVERAA